MYLEDMLVFCGDALSYVAGQDIDTLASDRMRLDATLRKLALIGEAATHVPESIRDLAPDVPWRKIVGTRNRLMHAYRGRRCLRSGASCRRTCRGGEPPCRRC
jgi:uncharacterized protein with HEPN domain